jgi:hypothetical protein
MVVLVLVVNSSPSSNINFLVSAGLLKSIMAYALSNRDYGIQVCYKHHCKEGISRGQAPEMTH